MPDPNKPYVHMIEYEDGELVSEFFDGARVRPLSGLRRRLSYGYNVAKWMLRKRRWLTPYERKLAGLGAITLVTPNMKRNERKR